MTFVNIKQWEPESQFFSKSHLPVAVQDLSVKQINLMATHHINMPLGDEICCIQAPPANDQYARKRFGIIFAIWTEVVSKPKF